MAPSLRRPPEFIWSESSFEPDPDQQGQVAQRWASFCQVHPKAFDGGVTHVANFRRHGCGGASLYLQPCCYRFHAVQDEEFDLGVRLLGVTALVVQDGRVLMGQRSEHVAHYKGMWEFGPSGVVEPGQGVERTLASEMREEVGLEMTSPPVAKAIVFDPLLRTWELVYQVQVGDGKPSPSAEYSSLCWVDVTRELPQPLSPLASQLTAAIRVSL